MSDLTGPEVFEQLKDSQGRFRTQSLFIQHKHDAYSAHFTLKNFDHDGYISMYQKYMEIGDPTEYQQAKCLLGSYEHWQTLAKAGWFKPYLNKWREELRARLESEAFDRMQETASAKKGLPTGIQATKWLADRYGVEQTKGKKRGRPSKDEKAAHLKLVEEEASDLAADAQRIGVST